MFVLVIRVRTLRHAVITVRLISRVIMSAFLGILVSMRGLTSLHSFKHVERFACASFVIVVIHYVRSRHIEPQPQHNTHTQSQQPRLLGNFDTLGISCIIRVAAVIHYMHEYSISSFVLGQDW